MSWFLFPGQGSQAPAMGLDYYENAPESRDALDQADAILGNDFLDTLFRGDAEALRDTRVAQPALVAVGVAIARHLIARGVEPTGCAGHSVGEIPALVIAGALDFEDALRLTRERARLMSENVPQGGMLAVMGLGPAEIEAALPHGAEVANYNGPQQTIVSGSQGGIEGAVDALKAAGAKRVLPLNVSGPFHSALMAPAGDALRAFIEPMAIEDPQLSFVSSVSGARETSGARIRELLWRQLAQPVRWTGVMTAIGQGAAFEVGPGTVLQGLAKRIDGAPTVSAAGAFDGVAAHPSQS